jgi:hypothetical protein
MNYPLACILIGNQCGQLQLDHNYVVTIVQDEHSNVRFIAF